MMPETAFTQLFSGLSDGAGDFTNTALVSNFIANIFLSGTMTLLWGLLHCMQIIAHFPLINVNMPANAQMLFKILIKIATFDMLPTEALI